MTDEHVFDLLPCYILGILDETEKRMVSRHLSTCAACRKELDSYTETPSHLGMAAPRLAPDANLKARVLCRVQSAANENASSTGKPPD